MHVAAALPAWCGPDGLPLSYRHFVYALSYLGRHALRRQLEHAQAFRQAQVDAEDFRDWQRDVIALTEVPR